MYGFKLFTVKLAQGLRGGRPADVSHAGPDKTEHFARYLVDHVFPKLYHLGTLTGKPRFIAYEDEGGQLDPIAQYQGEEWEPNDPRIRFVTSLRRTDNVFFQVRYGRMGQFDVAVAQSATDDSDISDKSATRMYRCYLMLPEEGPIGVLATETVSGSNPSSLVASWLKRASYELERDSGFNGEVYGLTLTPLTDPERLREAINRANSVKIRLLQKTISPSSNRLQTKILIEDTLTTEAERERVFDVVKRFLGLGSHPEDDDGVAELAGIVGQSVGAMEFDDGYIVFDTDDGTKKVGPNGVDEVFIYPVSETAPSDDQWLKAVKDIVSGRLTELGVDLDTT